MTHKPFSGVMTALITPFDKHNQIDFVALEKLIKYQKNAGINGIVVLGTTGENPTLTDDEAEKIVLTALEYRENGFHVYVGTGTNDTLTTVEKTLKFAKMKSVSGHGVDGVMVVTPYYNKPNSRCLINHYKEVASAVPTTPVCVYNVPGRTGINMTPQTFAKIAEENVNIVAIKEAAGNVNAAVEMRIELDKAKKSQVRILSGDDATYPPSLLCGAEGVISVTSHIIPGAMLQILSHFQKGNLHEMQRIHLGSYCINNGIFSVPNPIGVKWMLSHFGLCENKLRAPLYAADGKEAEVLEKILNQLEKNGIKVLS